MAFSGGNESANKRDKYKKMAQKYGYKIGTAMNTAVEVSKANRKYTFDNGLNSGTNSNSCSPSAAHLSPKGRFSINDRMNDLSKK